MTFTNCYGDAARAAAYAELEIANTYYLAYRDLPDIIRSHVVGRRALDFGCGAGRSTRFLRQLGFSVAGADISPAMIARAQEIEPQEDFRLVPDGDLSSFASHSYDLVTAIFPFDNIAAAAKEPLFRELAGLLRRSGTLLILGSSPEIYMHEWASFTTAPFPENRDAVSGDVVRIITKDGPDQRPVEDILCTDASYRDLFDRSGLSLLATYRPLATGEEPYRWVSETQIAPWTVYVLRGR